MKTMILASAVVALGIGSAFASDSDGDAATNPDTGFTLLPGVVSMPQAQQAPYPVAQNMAPATRPPPHYPLQQNGVWVFPPG
jgi:hypothetical protein